MYFNKSLEFNQWKNKNKRNILYCAVKWVKYFQRIRRRKRKEWKKGNLIFSMNRDRQSCNFPTWLDIKGDNALTRAKWQAINDKISYSLREKENRFSCFCLKWMLKNKLPTRNIKFFHGFQKKNRRRKKNELKTCQATTH